MGEPLAENDSRGNERNAADGLRTHTTLLDAELTGAVIGAFYRVYNRRGYGFLESVYREALRRELRKLGLHVEAEVLVEAWDDGQVVGRFRVDLLVEGRLIVELKASERLDPSARRQLHNYLRCCDHEVGLLLHFGPAPRVCRVIHTINAGRTHNADPRRSARFRDDP